jgi:TatD DNase family protein
MTKTKQHHPMQLIDTHCHLDLPQYDQDRDQVLSRAQQAGVQAQIIPAIQASTWPRIRQLCAGHPQLYPSYGMHPMFMQAHEQTHIAELDRWLKTEPAVAVGECGLDFYIKDPDRSGQLELFEAQLELAQRHRLPVIIHARKAVEEVINSLRHFSGIKGVLHSYSGSEQQAGRLIEMGFYLGFGGPVTYPRATRLQRLVQALPLEALLLETDAPDQPDSRHRGERNEPAHLGEILASISQLRGISPQALAAATRANARQLFRLATPI